MRSSRISDEQIAAAVRSAEAGAPVADIVRELGISEATFFVWTKRFAGLGAAEIHELRQLRAENAKLKRILTDLSVERHVCHSCSEEIDDAPVRAASLPPLRTHDMVTS